MKTGPSGIDERLCSQCGETWTSPPAAPKMPGNMSRPALAACTRVKLEVTAWYKRDVRQANPYTATVSTAYYHRIELCYHRIT